MASIQDQSILLGQRASPLALILRADTAVTLRDCFAAQAQAERLGEMFSADPASVVSDSFKQVGSEGLGL